MLNQTFNKIIAYSLLLLLFTQQVEAATDVKNDPSLSTNLISYWELEETNGTRTDSHTGGNDLTDNNTVLSATGIQGTAADFESSNSEYLSKADPGSWNLDIAGDMSVVAFVKFETYTTGSLMPIFYRDVGQPNRNWEFWVQNISGLSYLVMTASANGTNATTNDHRVQYTTGFSTATWYGLCWVYDASAGSIQAYVNGQGIGTTTGMTTSLYTGGTAPLRVGRHQNSTSYYDGIVDELGVWDKALTGSECSQWYNAGSGIPYDAGGAGGGEPSPVPSFLLISQLLVLPERFTLKA